MYCSDVRRETRSDITLSQVTEMVSTGCFPTIMESDNSLSPYLVQRNELTLLQGCVMWGNRVIVPPKLRQQVLEELHAGHLRVVKMKALAQSYVWWPGLDAQIEVECKICVSCQRIQKTPNLTPLHPWPWPAVPWQRIHIDFAGPFEGRMFFVVHLVDANSKWPEVIVMDSTTSEKTIQVLRGLFSHYGVPEVLVSDNGPQFTSEEFASFLISNGVKHTRSAPFHPVTNSLAERFLLQYRNTLHTTTQETPGMLLDSGNRDITGWSCILPGQCGTNTPVESACGPDDGVSP